MSDITFEKIISRRKYDDRVREHENLVHALQRGEVDAVLVLEGEEGARVAQLTSDEPLYRTVVDTLPQGVATVLADGTITYANHHLAGGIGLPAEALLGRNLSAYVVAADRPRFAAILEHAPDAPQEAEISFQWSTGAAPVLLSANRLPVSGVDAVGIVIVDLRDRLARRTAEEASRAKDEILASVSHEMRTPLTSIMGWVQLLHYELGDHPHLADALHNLKNAVLAESKIVDDLLDLTRAERGALSISMSEFDLRETVRTAISFIAGEAQRKCLALRVDLPEREILVRGDPDRLRQVFVNLLTNAVKFTREGEVSVRCHLADGAIRAAVADSGIGIPPEFLPLVFEPFRRSERVSGYPGLGIGLAITRRLVEAHGGTISAASEGAGRGATFTVELPPA